MVDAPWSLPPVRVARALDVDPGRGLSEAEADRRRERVGPNRLREHRRRGAWAILVDQVRSLVIGLLALAAAVAGLYGEWIEAGAIAVVLAINAAIGFVTELRAIRSMEALRRLGRVRTRVRRGGEERTVDAELLVPGDIVRMEGGDVVTADIRLLEASKLQADESTLTGESLPVGKDAHDVAVDTPLAERSPMLYKGTAITRGGGIGVVVATGMRTELGDISRLVEEAEGVATPLEARLDRLGRRLIFLTLGVAAAAATAGILAGKDAFLMFETGIALAVAAIPEGLPVVATIALARGMRTMARRNALINRLSSVETLGATDVICVDKTGTLTENRMTAVRLVTPTRDVEITGEGLATEGAFRTGGGEVDPDRDPALRAALEIAALCTTAALPARGDRRPSGDPMEVALLVAAAKGGIRRPRLLEEHPETRHVAFEVDTKMMATVHRDGDRYRIAVKGAPAAVLESADRELGPDGPLPLDEGRRREWLARNERMAAEGLRVLALASREAEDPDEEPFARLVLVGLVGFRDPPRAGIERAIASCRRAGIRVVMLTGDQPATARGIARATGLVDHDDATVVHGRDLEAGLSDERREEAVIFARVTPRHKLDLIEGYQRAGHIVAMTGDGVNDAPALRKADIGIAMGRRGTEVAQRAADMVLEDDSFQTILAAIGQGRTIFANIRRFVLYLLSCNLSELMTVGLASIASAPLPVLPLQLLFLNFVTDVFPALALGLGEGEASVMEQPPRDPSEPIVTRRHWVGLTLYGLLITAAVLAALALALARGMDPEQAVTISFLTLAFAQLWHVFDMRDWRSALVRNEITENPYVWGALALCTGFLAVAVYGPVLPRVLDLHDPGRQGWLIVLGLSVAPMLVGQLVMIVAGGLRRSP